MPTLRISNPANGKPVAALPADDAKSVKAKYLAARAAQPAWAATPLKKRLAALAKFRAAVIAQTEELAAILTTEVGKPISQSRNEIKGVIARIDFFLAETAKVLKPRRVSGGKGAAMEEVIGHEPLGVVANVSAWNYPYFVGANVFVPALATGNAVLYKPSEFATLTGLAIARLLHEVPRRRFIPVGAGEIGAALVKQPVDGVYFTGSYGTGKRIAQAVRGRMVRLQLELGGKDPVYVCEDVDIASAAAGIADGAFYNTGQSCCSVERIYVHEKIFDAFLAAFVKEVKGFDGRPAGGRHLHRPAHPRPAGEGARTAGGRCAPEGREGARRRQARQGQGQLVRTHRARERRPHDGRDARGELRPGHRPHARAGDAEAVRLMNDTDYGLTAAVYTKDGKRARRLLGQVHAGSVYWNCCDRVSPRLPWSGVGHSGIGLTLSTDGIEAFLRPKAWHLRSA